MNLYWCFSQSRHPGRGKTIRVQDKAPANKFYTKLCEEKPEMTAICFYYMQNLPLPYISVQKVFYHRQLWVNVFEIHNLKENTGHCYVFHEGEAHKGPNEL